MIPHPDSFKLIKAAHVHDDACEGLPDSNGEVGGVSHFALMGMAGHRAKLMLDNFGTLRKTLTPRQMDEVLKNMGAMWIDGFAMRGAYDRMHGEQERTKES